MIKLKILQKEKEMNEEFWFVLIFWLVMLILSFKFKNKFLFGITSITGIFFGIELAINVYAWLGFIVIIAGIYFLYYMFFSEKQ